MTERVFIVDDRPDILELNRILLEAEGYEATTYAYDEVTPALLREQGLGVVLLELTPENATPLAFLRRLRDDPATASVSVVVASTDPHLVEEALADESLHVSAGLVAPFEIDALYNAVAAAANHTEPIHPADNLAVSHAAAQALRANRRRVLFAWVQRLSTLDAFRQHPALSLAEVQGHGERLLDLVVDVLDMGEGVHVASSGTIGVYSFDGARSHGCARHAQGFDAPTLALEVSALRHEVTRVVHEAAPATAPMDEVWECTRRLDAALDEQLHAMLVAWREQEHVSSTEALDAGDAER